MITNIKLNLLYVLVLNLIIMRVFEKRFGFPVVEMWAMTETGRLISDNFEPERSILDLLVKLILV